MATEIEINSSDVPQYLCFNYVDGDRDALTIECNACSTGNYMFYDGGKREVQDSDWLTTAATHIQEYHTYEGKVRQIV